MGVAGVAPLATSGRRYHRHQGRRVLARPTAEPGDRGGSFSDDVPFRVTQDLLRAYPNLAGIFGITSVALPGAAEAIRQSGYAGKVAVTGLSTPNSMRQYVEDGTVRTFLLWSPVDLGYLTVHAAKKLIDDGALPAMFEAGRLGTIEVRDREVLLGPPIRFTKDNIDGFDF